MVRVIRGGGGGGCGDGDGRAYTEHDGEGVGDESGSAIRTDDEGVGTG